MKKRTAITAATLVLGGLFLLSLSCGKNVDNPSAPVGGSSGLAGQSWSFTTLRAPFSPRVGFSTASFLNAMWVIGGSNASTPVNDVWYSTDGENWTETSAAAAFSARNGLQALAYNNLMWVIGGYNGSNSLNDVWNTPDGANWALILNNAASPGSTQFPERWGLRTLVYNPSTGSGLDGKMWVIGGFGNGLYFNDVWSSTDGSVWTKVTGSAAFSGRFQHGCVVYNHKMWVIGGSNGGGNYLNDVWSSTDGMTWTPVLANSATPAPTQFPQRYQLQALVYNNQLWVIGGDNAASDFNDAWYSTDGVTWTQATSAAAFSPRYGQGGLVYNNEMWVIGGNDGYGYLNDVWKSP
jgi:hypothetical protein